MIEMPTYMLLRHKIRDFFEWKRVYDTLLMKRIEAGLVEKFLFRGIDDPNDIIILYQTRDHARAKTFAESDELREKMKQGGVVDKPEFHFVNSYSEALAKASGF
jgi:hypothetical protein